MAGASLYVTCGITLMLSSGEYESDSMNPWTTTYKKYSWLDNTATYRQSSAPKTTAFGLFS